MDTFETAVLTSDELENTQSTELALYLKNGKSRQASAHHNENIVTQLLKNPTSIKYLSTQPSDEVLITVLQSDPSFIRFWKDCSEEVENAALRLNPLTLKYIKYPTIKQQNLALTVGQKEGKFNIEVIAACSHKLDKRVLDKVKPGLHVILHLYEGDTKEECMKAVDSFIENRTDDHVPAFLSGFSL